MAHQGMSGQKGTGEEYRHQQDVRGENFAETLARSSLANQTTGAFKAMEGAGGLRELEKQVGIKAKNDANALKTSIATAGGENSFIHMNEREAKASTKATIRKQDTGDFLGKGLGGYEGLTAYGAEQQMTSQAVGAQEDVENKDAYKDTNGNLRISSQGRKVLASKMDEDKEKNIAHYREGHKNNIFDGAGSLTSFGSGAVKAPIAADMASMAANFHYASNSADALYTANGELTSIGSNMVDAQAQIDIGKKTTTAKSDKALQHRVMESVMEAKNSKEAEEKFQAWKDNKVLSQEANIEDVKKGIVPLAQNALMHSEMNRESAMDRKTYQLNVGGEMQSLTFRTAMVDDGKGGLSPVVGLEKSDGTITYSSGIIDTRNIGSTIGAHTKQTADEVVGENGTFALGGVGIATVAAIASPFANSKTKGMVASKVTKDGKKLYSISEAGSLTDKASGRYAEMDNDGDFFETDADGHRLQKAETKKVFNHESNEYETKTTYSDKSITRDQLQGGVRSTGNRAWDGLTRGAYKINEKLFGESGSPINDSTFNSSADGTTNPINDDQPHGKNDDFGNHKNSFDLNSNSNFNTTSHTSQEGLTKNVLKGSLWAMGGAVVHNALMGNLEGMTQSVESFIGQTAQNFQSDLRQKNDGKLDIIGAGANAVAGALVGRENVMESRNQYAQGNYASAVGQLFGGAADGVVSLGQMVSNVGMATLSAPFMKNSFSENYQQVYSEGKANDINLNLANNFAHPLDAIASNFSGPNRISPVAASAINSQPNSIYAQPQNEI